MKGTWLESERLMQFKEALLIERERLLLFAPVVLGIGIIFGVFFPFLNWNSLFVFIALAIAISAIFYKKHKFLFGAIFIFSLGVYISQTGGIFETKLLSQKKFITQEYEGIDFTAVVSFIDETHPSMKNMRRIAFKEIKFNKHPELDFIKTAKMTCSVAMTDNIVPNDIVKVKGKISPFKPPAIPGSFDQIQYNSLVKLDTGGIVYYIKKLEDGDKMSDLFPYLRRVLTKKITDKIEQPAGGLASALLTGDKSPISPDVRDKFINSGTAHILAISGLHMSIVASIVFIFFMKFFQYMSCIFHKINSKRFAAVVTIPMTFLYLALSGFSPSATRAFIMTTVFLISVIFGRGSLSLRSVSFAAFFILLFDSGSLFLVSFQLSFCAVLALISFYESFQYEFSELKMKQTSVAGEIIFYILASFITTTIASLATFPISIATFNRISLSGLLGNIVAIPAISFIIMPLGILALLMSCLTDIFIIPLTQVLNKLTLILGFISEIPGSNLTIKSPSLIALYIMVFGGIILCLLKSKLRLIGAGGILIGFLLWIFESKPDVIFPPATDSVCFIENGKFYTKSLQKGRKAMLSIQRNLGFDGKLEKKDFPYEFEQKKYENGLFIWHKTNQFKELAKRAHPYCPAYFIDINKDQ